MESVSKTNQVGKDNTKIFLDLPFLSQGAGDRPGGGESPTSLKSRLPSRSLNKDPFSRSSNSHPLAGKSLIPDNDLKPESAFESEVIPGPVIQRVLLDQSPKPSGTFENSGVTQPQPLAMFAYLSKKLEMSSGVNVRALAWSGTENYLACGCDSGLLKVLKIEVGENGGNSKDGGTNNKGSTGGEGSTPQQQPKGYLAAPTNVSLNQTLEGHSSPIQAIAWNNVKQKLTTSDSKGSIVVWVSHKGSWYEEMVNNRNKSVVRGVAWAQDGDRVAIAYEDGGVIVGTAEGSRLWSKELGSGLSGVAWSPAGSQLVFPLRNGEVHVYDGSGNFMSKLLPEKFRALSIDLDDREDGDEKNDPIATVKWYGSYIKGGGDLMVDKDGDSGELSLAVAWTNGLVYFFRGLTDEKPIQTETPLRIRTGEWSPNGLYFAVGGTDTRGRGDTSSNSIQSSEIVWVIGRTGKILCSLRIPSGPCTSLAWDSWSLRLAIGSGPFIYFANIRPDYKFGFYGGRILVFPFTRPDGSNHLAFWDGDKMTSQGIAGTVLDLDGNDEYCAVLTGLDAIQGQGGTTGPYLLNLLNTLGIPVDTVSISTMAPFTFALTQGAVISLAPNALHLWRFLNTSRGGSSSTSKSGGGGRTLSSAVIPGLRGREKSFHLDEAPTLLTADGGMDGPGVEQSTNDPGVAVSGVNHLFAVARESGRILLYSLPHGLLVSRIDAALELEIRPRNLYLNCDGSALGLLDFDGLLYICTLSALRNTNSIQRIEGRKDVWDCLWARDDPKLLCIMEKTRMYVLKDGDVEEPILTSGYIASFKDLQVTSVLMDEVSQAPESPNPELILRFESRSLRDTRQLLASGASLKEVFSFLETQAHPRLWALLASESLSRLDVQMAETAFVKSQDYSGIQLSKRLSAIGNPLVREGEVAAFFKDFDKAERLFLEAQRRDLALDMRRLLGHWDKVETLSLGSAQNNRVTEKESRRAALAQGDSFAEEHNWTQALNCYKKVGDPERLFNAYVALEDFEELSKLGRSLPVNHSLLPDIARVFVGIGQVEEAVDAFLSCEQSTEAIETCIKMGDWTRALAIAAKFGHQWRGMDVLYQYAGKLVGSGKPIQAVQVLRAFGKPFGAAKLLAMIGLHSLIESSPGSFDPLVVKKLFVFAALTMSGGGGGPLKDDTMADHQLYSATIPPQFHPPLWILSWLRSNPWHGAQALHFFLLAQRHFCMGDFLGATKTALHLPRYTDILGEERVDSIIILAAVRSECYGAASRAFMRLEARSQEMREVAAGLFSQQPPVDYHKLSVSCDECRTEVPLGSPSCPDCGNKFNLCVKTGGVISGRGSPWICSCCGGLAEPGVTTGLVSCPLCHSPSSGGPILHSDFQQ